MCKILGVKKLQTMPCHLQTNGLVERSHQTMMRMIRKLGKGKKANWPGHLAEIAHAYNATCSTVTRYSLHYLMFGQRPRFPVNFYFPTFRSTEDPMTEVSAKHVDEYMATVHEWLRTTLQEAQVQSTAEAHWQKLYYDWKIGAINSKPGDLVLVRPDGFKGKRKIKDRWEEETCKVVHQITTDIPILWSDGPVWMVTHPPPETDFFSLHQRLAFPCVEASIMHRTGVPAPPHTSPLPKEVKIWWCHKNAVAGWSPNAQPARLPWGGLMGSYDFYCGHLLEHPREDGWRHQVTYSRHMSQKKHVHLAEGMTSLPIDAIR